MNLRSRINDFCSQLLSWQPRQKVVRILAAVLFVVSALGLYAKCYIFYYNNQEFYVGNGRFILDSEGEVARFYCSCVMWSAFMIGNLLYAVSVKLFLKPFLITIPTSVVIVFFCFTAVHNLLFAWGRWWFVSIDGIVTVILSFLYYYYVNGKSLMLFEKKSTNVVYIAGVIAFCEIMGY